MHFSHFGGSRFEIDIYHNSKENPIERVGQGTVIPPTEVIGQALGINWHNNPIDATFKSGFMYEGWGQKQEKIFHNFPMNTMAMHYVPQKLSETVLQSDRFRVTEKRINNPELEIDADIIFDCRGRHNRDLDNYEPLINPLNSVLLCNVAKPDLSLHYTRCIATPNGWTFIIPTKAGLSYGYLYNNTITTREDAEQDFLERFDIPEVDGELVFENYMAKNIFVGERTVLNGNKLFFLEPMEATAMDLYQSVCRYMWDYLVGSRNKSSVNTEVIRVAKEMQNFVLWHYQTGSKYDSPFWDYTRTLSYNYDERFKTIVNQGKDMLYGAWNYRSFDIWMKGI